MTDQPEQRPSRAERLIDELAAFAASEAESLDALADELSRLRDEDATLDVEAIWANVGLRLRRAARDRPPVSEEDGDDARDPPD